MFRWLEALVLAFMARCYPAPPLQNTSTTTLESPLEASESPVEPSLPPPPTPTSRERLYTYAKSCIGKDMAPLNDALGCAESLSHVLRGHGLNNPIIAGTAQLDDWLRKHCTTITEPLPGDIIMSPTGQGNGTVRGHCGIVGKTHIMSNNSLTYLWDAHWNLAHWRTHYGVKGGLPVRFYRVP